MDSGVIDFSLYLIFQDTSNLTKVLKEKLEYRPKSCQFDPVSVTTNVSDRLARIKDASGNWKNRVETKDAEKFTVAAKMSNQPAELPFKKSNVRTTVPMTEFQCANASPLGLAKSPSMMVSSVTNGGSKTIGLQLPAFSRSVSVPGSGEAAEGGSGSGVKVVVPKLDEDKMFDRFFTKSSSAKDETTMEWDLDAITSTQRWVEMAKTLLLNNSGCRLQMDTDANLLLLFFISHTDS